MSQRSSLGSLPRLPTDVFAFAAHLVERSGAYHHISPEVLGPAPNNFRRIVVGDQQRNRAVAIGLAWRNGVIEPGARLPSPPLEVEQMWGRLNGFRNAAVFEPIDDVAAAPDWWTICLDLVMITDEACRDIGFQATNPFFEFFMQEYAATDLSSATSSIFSVARRRGRALRSGQGTDAVGRLYLTLVNSQSRAAAAARAGKGAMGSAGDRGR